MIFGEIMRTIIFLSLPMITMTICAVVITMNDDSDDDLCEGGGNCRLSAEPRVADIPGPEQRLIIVILATLGPGQLDHLTGDLKGILDQSWANFNKNIY